jgi:large subunit ribosomal protein L12
MEYVYSALLLHAAGQEISEAGIEKVIKAAGVKPDATRIKALTASLEGVNVEEVLSSAMAAPVAATPAPEAKEEEKEGKEKKEKKEKKDEVSEEEAAAGLGALFG